MITCFKHIIPLILVMPLGLSAQDRSRPFNLIDAVGVALNKNPRTTANNIRLKSLLESVQAERAEALPRVYVRGVQGYDRNPVETSYRSWQVGLSVNLFNNFADSIKVRAAQCEHDRQAAEYNSTNTQILNTQGQLAGLVVKNYIEIAQMNETLVFIERILNTLSRYQQATSSEDQKSRIRQYADSIEIFYKELKFKKMLEYRQFEYLTTVPAPSQFESIDQTISRIVVPETETEAFEYALEKSPEVVTAQLRIQCSQLSLEVDKRTQYGPRVDLEVYYRNDRIRQPTLADSSNATGVNLTFGMSFGASDQRRNRAQVLLIEAASEDLRGATADIKNDLARYYPTIDNLLEVIQSYSTVETEIESGITGVLEKISKNQPIDLAYALELVKNLDYNQGQAMKAKQELIQNKFLIQKRIGSLFDNLQLTDVK